jgi:membrane fusion protein (multidrug efflux system)
MPTTAETSSDRSSVADSSPAAGSDDNGSVRSSTGPAGPKAQPPPSRGKRRPLRIIAGVVGIVAFAAATPWIIRALNTVSTDDAYVNGHVTFVAPRVGGQVAAVLVDDNNRVRKGDVLVRLDREPFQVQVDIAQAALESARTGLVIAEAEARALTGQTRGLRFSLEHAIQDVDNQVALLKAKVATLNSRRANLVRAQSDFDRADKVRDTGVVSADELAQRRESLDVTRAQVEEALQGVYQVRASLGLPLNPATDGHLDEVPPDLDQTFSTVRQAQASLLQAAAKLGFSDSFAKAPSQLIADFYKRDPQGDVDRIYAQLLRTAPGVKGAEAKLAEAQRNVEQAQLNLRYCDVVAEIDGVVTRRNVNPGNNVVAGQSVMAVRSLSEIWVDANFKETQLGRLRIGQAVDLDVDMYGGRRHFRGRITGFTYGTGSTLALLPAENATGNFVKVVQRLPVRVELADYDPDHAPLFVGLSVTASVDLRHPPGGPDPGRVLQPYLAPAGGAGGRP